MTDWELKLCSVIDDIDYNPKEDLLDFRKDGTYIIRKPNGELLVKKGGHYVQS